MPSLRQALLRLCWLGLVACENAAGPEQHVHDVDLDLLPLSAAGRPVPGSSDLPAFHASDRVEHYDSASGFFRVHYTRSGPHAVPAVDADRDGVPDYVSKVAGDFDEVRAFYKQLGYREPVRDGDVPGEKGGDDRFDVYLLDFPMAGADGQFRPDISCAAERCGGYMILENDFTAKGYRSVDRAIRLVSSHELFHAVQYAYVSGAINGSLSEGTAVWASEAFDAEAGDLESQSGPLLDRLENSLAQDPSGTDPIRYGAALFFQLIDEHASRDALRDMWQNLADGEASWTHALDDALHQAGSSLSEEYKAFVQWNLFTGERADPERGYAHGDQLQPLKERSVELGYSADSVRVFPLAARHYALQSEQPERVTAAAALPEAADIDDLELMIAIEHQGKITSIEHAPHDLERQVSAQLEAGDVAHIALYNTRIDGGSAQPKLCIGDSPEAVADCGAAAESGDEAAADSAPSKSSGGCAVQLAPRVHGAGAPWTPWGALALLLAGRGLLRRARRLAFAQRARSGARSARPTDNSAFERRP